jgi:GTPase
MSKKKALPHVVLVGRVNVGKSTIFNRLSTDVKSITLDYEGVTRDFITDTVSWQGVSFQLVDSGGISLKKHENVISERVRQIALSLIDKADVVLFVVDGTVGITREDTEIARYIRKKNAVTVLVVNKIDTMSKEYEHRYQVLGFDHIVPISALHGKNIDSLLGLIVTTVQEQSPKSYVEEEIAYKVALLGKPNVGKSSLLNTLLEEDRVLVSDQPGTTREPLSATMNFFQEHLQITDTPGIRRQRAIEEDLEKIMVKTAFRAVDRADIILLLIDGSECRLSDQELKLAFYVIEQHKSLILLVNKSDLMEEEEIKAWDFSTSEYEFFLKKIPVLFISCKTGKNVTRILPLVQKVWQRSLQQFTNSELTTLFKTALQRTPLFHSGMPLEVYRVKQVGVSPITIVMEVNKPDWFGPSQCMFFENILRDNYDLVGASIRFVVRKR